MTLRKKCFIIRQSLISVLGSSSTCNNTTKTPTTETQTKNTDESACGISSKSIPQTSSGKPLWECELYTKGNLNSRWATLPISWSFRRKMNTNQIKNHILNKFRSNSGTHSILWNEVLWDSRKGDHAN